MNAPPNEAIGEPSSLLVGTSPAIQEIRSEIAMLAATNSTVLILGETGVGKEIIARSIHMQSSRSSAPFIAVNCGALPETLLESELFGHERGAFTGATNLRMGKFEQADNGTIFLDEVHTLSPATQVKLLRVLQERILERLGGTNTVNLDIRVLAATNLNLVEAVQKKEFREDLYHRLVVCIIAAPPLRKHAEDIPELAARFVKEFALRDGMPVRGLTDAAIALLKRHTWPGNVRQLKNIVERAFNKVCTTGAAIDESVIEKAFDVESAFTSLGQHSAPSAQEPDEQIASLVFEDLINDRVPLEGIKNRSERIGAVASCMMKGIETGFKQFLETDRGQVLLRNLSPSDVMSRVGLSSRRGGSNAIFIRELRDRLSKIAVEMMKGL